MTLYNAIKTMWRRCPQVTLKACHIVQDALRAKLMDADVDSPAFKLKPKTVRGHAPPNVDISDREALYDVLDRS